MNLIKFHVFTFLHVFMVLAAGRRPISTDSRPPTAADGGRRPRSAAAASPSPARQKYPIGVKQVVPIVGGSSVWCVSLLPEGENFQPGNVPLAKCWQNVGKMNPFFSLN